MLGRLPRIRWAWILILLLVASGCSTYASKSARLRDAIAAGDYDAALEQLDADSDDVLELLQRGLLLSYAGRFTESNDAFHRAEDRIDELYTKSVSREAAAFVTNDATLPYTGWAHERVLLHLYSALNYLSLGERDGALVECRRVGLLLDQMQDGREGKRYQQDGFAEYLAGVLYADDGDGNSAMVSARRALSAYDEQQEWLGQPVPELVVHDAIGWAERFNFLQEAEELKERYPEQAASYQPRRADQGDVLLIYESGFVSKLVEIRVDFPILKSDTPDDEEFAEVVYSRGPKGTYVAPSDVEIDYWVSVALPQMVHEPPFQTHARMRSTDGASVGTEPVEDVSAIAQLLFDEKAGNRAVRTIVRGLAKYGMTKAAEEENEALGVIANIFGAATERADTRSWSMLPDKMHMARLRLPEGTHRVVVEVLDVDGQVAQTATFDDVIVRPGDLTLLQHRSYH